MLRARAAKGIEEEVEQGVEIPVGKGFAGRVVAERRAIAIEDVDHADIFNPILREKGIRSLLGVPLVAKGRPIGVLHVGSLVRRVFTPGERHLLQVAADRAALAIAYAELLERERAARAAEEAARRRLEALQRITDAALAYLPEEELLTALLDRISAVMGTDTAAILLLDPGARRAARAGREGYRGGGRAGRGDPGRQGVRGTRGRRAAGDRHRGRRPRRHPQPDPAREGHPLAARRAAAGRGAPDRRAARRQPHAAPLQRGGARPPPAGRRPRGAGHRPRDAVRAAPAGRDAPAPAAAEEPRARRRRSRSPAGTCRPSARRSAATGTTRSRSTATGSRSPSATWSGTASRPPP